MSVPSGVKTISTGAAVKSYRLEESIWSPLKPTGDSTAKLTIAVEAVKLVKVPPTFKIVPSTVPSVNKTSVINNVLSAKVADMSLIRTLFGLYSKEDKLQALESLDKVGILDKAFTRADQLSGGQMQRVALARTLTQNPEIILADEPVASLDPIMADVVMEDFCRINEEMNITVIINIHHVDLALQYAKRVVGINSGRIVYDGPASEVNKEILRKIYGRDLNDDEVMKEKVDA